MLFRNWWLGMVVGGLLVCDTACGQAAKSKVAQIEEGLRKPLTVEFTDTPLNDVLDFLRNLTNVQFHVDRRRLDEAGLAVDSPVTLNLKEVRLEQVLDLVLDSHDLEYAVRDGFILISSRDHLAHQRETRVYPCQDLLAQAAKLASRTVVDGGPQTPADSLIEVLQAAVHPESWDTAGGAGSIRVLGDRLIVSNSQRAHRDLTALLEQLNAR